MERRIFGTEHILVCILVRKEHVCSCLTSLHVLMSVQKECICFGCYLGTNTCWLSATHHDGFNHLRTIRALARSSLMRLSAYPLRRCWRKLVETTSRPMFSFNAAVRLHIIKKTNVAPSECVRLVETSPGSNLDSSIAMSSGMSSGARFPRSNASDGLPFATPYRSSQTSI